MKRRTLLLAAAASATAVACRRSAYPESQLARSVLGLAQRSARTDPGAVDWVRQELERLAQRVAAQHASGLAPAAAIARVLFDELGFVRDVDSTSLEHLLLPGVLQARRGSCVGLGTVYLCLAEMLGFSAHGVLRPGHFYVQQAAPGVACNVELLRHGELMPDSWYQARFPLTQPDSKSYGRALSPREVLGVTAYDIGNEWRRQHELELARRAYHEAISAFPEFAEAHASLGATEQLLGDRPAAAASYARALELDSSLPGVERNLALLTLDGDQTSASTR